MRRLLVGLLRQRPQGLRTDFLWLIIVLVGCLSFTSLIPLPPNDFWWHLKIGELILIAVVFPRREMSGWTMAADTPFVYAAWLGEVLLYLLYHIGQLQLVILFARRRAGALTLVGYEGTRRSGSWRLGALAAGLTCAVSLNNLIVRPQVWLGFPLRSS